MKIRVIDTELQLTVSGFSGTAVNKNYGATAFALMDKMWPVIRAKGLKHKGLNIWVYEAEEKVFAGVELEDPSAAGTGLEQKTILLRKYASYKHIGSYSQIEQAGDSLHAQLRELGLKATLPYIEIYGHWTDDETKLETELLIAIDES